MSISSFWFPAILHDGLSARTTRVAEPLGLTNIRLAAEPGLDELESANINFEQTKADNAHPCTKAATHSTSGQVDHAPSGERRAEN